MARRVELLSGRRRVAAATRVLQRIRLAHPTAGLWEAADVQWWWRRPRSTDDLAVPVWFDELGACAAVVLTDWGAIWQADALAVPGTVPLETVWQAVLDAVPAEAPPLEVLTHEDDVELLRLVGDSQFTSTQDCSGLTWMNAARRPSVAPLPDGFTIVDRRSAGGRPHPMRVRNGEDVEARLRQCSLYDPGLDLAVETTAGKPAGYALFWFDGITSVGMLEPMRVEDAFQGHGLGRALLTEGLERLARRGAPQVQGWLRRRSGPPAVPGSGVRAERNRQGVPPSVSSATSPFGAWHRQPSVISSSSSSTATAASRTSTAGNRL